MQISSNVTLHQWQKDTIKGILQFPHDIHIVKAQRQRGKSICMEQLILYFALNKAHTNNIYISPTFGQCSKVYNEILNAVQNTSIFKKANGGLFKIEFINGSSIQFLAASQSIDHLQGYTASGILIIDESAYITDDVHFAVFPFADANKAPIVLVSTPRFKQGIFYEMFTDETTHSYDWCKYDTSCMLSNERLEQYRKKLPKIKFIQQYMGEFTDANSSVFGEFSKVLHARMMPTSVSNVVFGIDWSTGVGGDETAIAIFDTTNNMQLDIVHFSDKDANQTIDEILKLINIYKPSKIVVEKNSIGQVFYDVLKLKVNNIYKGVTIIPFVTSNESKTRLVDSLAVAIQNSEVGLVDDDTLVLQMSNYVGKLTQSGKVSYQNSKDSIHDDCVMATMLGFYAINHAGKYVIR